jgi:hypothetical protein
MTKGRAGTTSTLLINSDTAFDLLANGYRRDLLFALLEERSVDAFDPQIRSERAEPGDREALEIRAFHAHLPKLEDEGIIEWNRRNNEVRTGPHFDEIRPLLRVLYDHDELPQNWF